MLARAVLVAVVASSGASAQQAGAHCPADSATTTIIRAVVPRIAPAPFALGEDLRYDVSFGRIHVGSGYMRLAGRDTVDGRDTWHAVLDISGGFSFLSVHDSAASWFDPLTFTTRRFLQELREPRYRSSRYYDVFPDRQAYHQRGKTELPSVADPMDDVSFVYFVRTLPLEPGQCYELARYFRPDGNPVVIRVVGRDTVSVPAGRFPAIRLQPEITTSALFSRKGRAELWLSDDSARVVLQLKAQLPFGSINLYLKTIGTVAPPP